MPEAIEELNIDIQERERKGQQVQEKIDREIFHLEFVSKELEKWTLGQVEMIEKEGFEKPVGKKSPQTSATL